MKWVKKEDKMRVPVKSWCAEMEDSAMLQATNLAKHPAVYKHVALMPDCHTGYGMPIGGVIGLLDTVIPNAVGVDIGCGMGAVETDFPADRLKDKRHIREILDFIKERVPLGEGKAHKTPRQWTGFEDYLRTIGIETWMGYDDERLPGWLDKHSWELAYLNLGSLGGGNHFIELQVSEEGKLWMMLHSGSRNLGYRIAALYHKMAQEKNALWKTDLPDKDLAFLPLSSTEGQNYVRDMEFALRYAQESRARMMNVFKEAVSFHLPGIKFVREINIHHNYAALEHHFEMNLWVHRKGATSAKKGQLGIIPGSMGTPSYIVEGLGNPESFESCSHGAGRKMGRMHACRTLSMEECEKAMEGIVYDRWKTVKKRKRKDEKLMDFGEAPLAYKDIDEVIEAEKDLIKPLVKLRPLGVLKG
ncbi:MAG: RtcB family protein [bacterium]|nr:RtcB family protein [bacterium]